MADKVDPFDIAALERSLNDSATRVSTIWVSFLIFSLYLLTAATTVTHRQLFLAEPLKLPVLNIDLPLWGFFFLAPILFVILHAYVLLQVLLLARTAAAYNAAVERAGLPPEENASLRQRLANTLFAQIFAGSPREREGWLGWLLKAMAWITLAIAPILILLVFQFAFLPYHSHIATWTHRFLILVELAAAFVLWPLVLDARRDFYWPNLRLRLTRTAVLSFRMLRQREGRPHAWQGLRQQALPLVSSVLFVFISLSLATFPGEPHVNMFTGQSLASVQCERWFQQKFDRIDLQFDRLVLPGIDVVDDEILAKIVQHTSDRKLEAYEGERTRNFRHRDLNCSDLSSADLRRVDLTSARLSGSRLDFTALEGALLDSALLQHASLRGTKLQDASLENAQLQEASLNNAQLQGTSLILAQLQGTSFSGAWLQGASLVGAELQGAFLREARLQGASLDGAQLQGASLDAAELQGASLNRAVLHGASLSSAQLQGASVNDSQLQGTALDGAQLQGSDLNKSSLTFADLSGAYVWRAKDAACRDAYVIGHKPDSVIEISRMSGRDDELVQATPDEITKFIERSVGEIRERDGYRMMFFSGAYVPYMLSKSWTTQQMRTRLIADPAKDDTADTAKIWSDCEEASRMKPQGELIQFLRDLVCNARDNRKTIGNGVIRNWITEYPGRPGFSALLALGLLSEDGKECAATKDLDERTKERLWVVITAAADKAAVSAPSAAPPQ